MQSFARRLALGVLLTCGFSAAYADGTAQTLPFNQDWTNAGLITVNDDWSAVPGVEGFLGQELTATTGTDPQTLTGTSAVPADLDVIANQTNPNTLSAGGAAEFAITNPVVALQGSGTGDAPNLIINLNTVGKTGINVAYNLRDIDGSADNAVQPVALQYRVGNTGAFTNVPAGFVADASTGPNLATLVTPVAALLPAAAEGQALVQVRIITANAVGNDEWIGIDDIAITGSGGGGSPTLSIADVTVNEGDSGTQNATFTVQLSSAAGVGGVAFDIATADDTATAGSDYVANALTGQTIPQGASTYTFTVVVNGDTAVEPNESFLVNVTNVTGANVGDGQARATIVTDDFAIVAIHAIQGTGATSPLAGQTVTTIGIVTGRKGNGYFLQAADVDADANSATSEGIFVFTSTTPPVQAAVGNRVRVSGTVVEFIPPADPGQLPFTELTNATTIELSTGNSMPTPVQLTTTFPDPANPALDQLERVEGMRVTAASFTVVAPTRGSVNETNATATSNGQINLVVTGVARPLREPGIQNPDPAPGGGSIPPIPRWDFNPELMFSDTDGIGAPRLDLAAGATLTNYVGPMDYGFRRYSIYPDPAVTPVIVQPAPTAARPPLTDEFTVASYNLERFFDTINDAVTDDPVLTAAAYANRLNKASLGIRNFLNTPDILGVVEVEKLSVLQDLAAKINADAVTAGQPDPQYVAYLQEGNDIGGIDNGFLVKSADVAVGVDRVEVVAVTQLGKDIILTNPDNSTAPLNDRPPLQLDAKVHYTDGREFPITVIVVHQRSLSGADGNDANGERVRNKRQKQAEYLAGIVQAMQVANAQRNISLVGDFNAFEFNDGLVDAMAVVSGIAFPDNTTVVPGDGADLVTTDLLNLASEETPDQRYSFVFDGNAQSLDHVLINQALGASVADYGLDHARINADFPSINRNDANSASRLSDHDPAVAYFAASSADLSVTASVSPYKVPVGGTMTFNATITNEGPDAARFPGVGFAFTAELPDLAVTAPTGWSCGAPIVGSGQSSVACASTLTLSNAATATFQLTASAPAERLDNAVFMAAGVTSQTGDPDPDNNTANAWINVVRTADLAMILSGPALLTRSTPTAVFRATLTNNGPATTNPSVLLQIDVPQASVSMLPLPNWRCVRSTTPTFSANCFPDSGSMPANENVAFDMQIATPGRLGKSRINASTGVVSDAFDPQPANDVDLFSVRVAGGAPSGF